jgi:hypothetical protein
MARFPIRFDSAYALLSRALLLRPSDSFIDVDGPEVRVQMGWAFRARFPLSAVQAATRFAGKPLSRGVHGWAGRWLVNGSGEGIVQIDLSPPQRAFMFPVPLRLRQLLVSVEEPAAFIAAITGRSVV